jgi:N-carbamoylputrescine amidase
LKIMKIAGVQFQGNRNKEVNIQTSSRLIRQAAEQGAKIICLPELFNTIYFCYDQVQENFQLAEPIPGPTTEEMATLAREVRAVLICPIFEKAMKGEYYNSAAVLGPNGELLGKYRKNHLPLLSRLDPKERTGNEKFYFRPGNLGFPVFSTPFGVTIGILICYDRHFPEAARILALKGADILFVPTATPSGFTRYVWEIELKAHATDNIYYICGVNKVGRDEGGSEKVWYGTSLIINPQGEILAQGSDRNEEVVIADIDLTLIEKIRTSWNFFRDRRPEIYGELVR